MGERTDRELVLDVRPAAAVERRVCPRTGAAEYRVIFTRGGDPRTWTRVGWSPSEAAAWRAACARLGLRAAGATDRG